MLPGPLYTVKAHTQVNHRGIPGFNRRATLAG